MKREQIADVIGGIDERFIAEASHFDPAGASAPERNDNMKVKRIVTLALAAALILSLSIAAYATYAAVSTPQAAEKVAREQIEVWKALGLLSPEVNFDRKADQIYEFEARDGGDYWYGRLFPHHYDVRWFVGKDGAKYGCNLSVDTLTGKITQAFIDARADEGREPLFEETLESEPGQSETWKFYDNYEDIFPADLTVDDFCTLLAEYWGFTGYRLADTVEQQYYHRTWEAVDGSTLLKDIPNGQTNYFLTVFFEGDQDGAPMYIQITPFAGYCDLCVGTGHAVG